MKHPPLERLTVRKDEMAAMLGINVATLDNWIAARKIRYLRIGKVILFDPRDVIEDIKKFEVSAVVTS